MSAGRDARGGEAGRRAGGGFLGRWSERKLKARAEPDQEPVVEEARETGLPAEPGPPRSEAEVLEELGLPDPDTLVKGDDFSGFMRKAVPSALRNRALRRLWLTDPVLANLDGLNDYEQDFTAAATVVPNLKTAYRVGLGYLRDEPVAAPETASEAEPGSAADASGQPGGAEEQAGDVRADGAQADAGGAGDDQAGDAGSPEHGPEHGRAFAGEPEPGQGGAGEAGDRPDEPIERADAGDAPDGALRARRMRFRFDG